MTRPVLGWRGRFARAPFRRTSTPFLPSSLPGSHEDRSAPILQMSRSACKLPARLRQHRLSVPPVDSETLGRFRAGLVHADLSLGIGDGRTVHGDATERKKRLS